MYCICDKLTGEVKCVIQTEGSIAAAEALITVNEELVKVNDLDNYPKSGKSYHMGDGIFGLKISNADIEDAVNNIVDKYLNDVAISLGYSSSITIRLYAATDNKYSEESKKFIDFSASVWETAYMLSNKYIATVTLPDEHEVVKLLPIYTGV